MMKPATKKNLLFTLAVLLVAGALLALRQFTRPAAVPEAVPTALLQYGRSGEYEMRIPLEEDNDYYVPTGPYTVHLLVQDGRICFTDSPCPDHVCEGFGWLQNPGDWAACLPAYAMLTIEGELS